ncbi:ADP-ribosylation factor-like protein 6-interacting protein 4 [Pimephales promelas]|uniref:ADP-ribosylation factor-like protein 6-interacting protein 4 n=1 Tax=Pimephales promelas TaxID=90988 RepID=UPI00195583D2|nr:ADP-ribosylation factor-like protein 6-interacting protein 4 [Pimephales promelas]XP_039518094.1 ADP-ribosylation factor-like protein 6-interacting protein 4 [Pimephales promelas]
MGGSDAERRSKIRTGEESKSQSLSSSSSARRPSPSLQKKHERSTEKKRMKRSRSSSSSSSSSTSSSREKKAKKKKKRREEKKLKREKKREKKEKKRQKKLALKAAREASVPTRVSEEQLSPFLQTWLNEETKEPGPVMTDEQKETFCTKRPMTKEEYDARQSIIRRVVDPETGRTRLIRGDGEVLEEIVTKERHKDINKQATKGDGDAFQKRLGINR